MPLKSKRARSSLSHSVSPPRVKRKTAVSKNPSAAIATFEGQRLRIFSWNVNGIDAFLQRPFTFSKQAESSLRSFLRRHEWPQFLCLQEVEMNSRDEVAQRRLRHAANSGGQSDEPTYVTHFSLPRDKFNATGFGGKVYGVATLIREDFACQIDATRIPDWDLEGRVLIHEMENNVALVNGYWVNGTDNPYRNPQNGVAQGTRHDHKLRFHEHMPNEVLRLEQKGFHVILVGDMNVARHRVDGYPNLRTSPLQHVKNRSDFNEKFFTDENGFRAIDVFRQLHGEKRKYTYHPRGVGWGQSCDRIDLIIVTKSLFDLGAVESSDICDNPKDREHSDHVPIWIEINSAKLPHANPPKSGDADQNSKSNLIAGHKP